MCLYECLCVFVFVCCVSVCLLCFCVSVLFYLCVFVRECVCVFTVSAQYDHLLLWPPSSSLLSHSLLRYQAVQSRLGP